MSVPETIAAALAARERDVYDPFLSPGQFSYNYVFLPVVRAAGHHRFTTHVSVHKYRLNTNGDTARHRRDVVRGKRISDDVADRELGVAGRMVRSWCDQNGDLGARVRRILISEARLTNAFMGKASPRDISLCLAVLNATGHLSQKYPQKGEWEALQQYCDEHIGMDCSGLVNSFFIGRGHLSDLWTSRNIIISRWGGDRQRRLEAPLPYYPRGLVMVWDDYSHIALIDGWKIRGQELWVCESGASLGGITMSGYQIVDWPRRQNSYKWHFRRLLKPDHLQRVWIVRPLERR